MRRNWDCIRAILEASEALEDGVLLAPGILPGFSEDQVVGHIRLLEEAGLVEGYPKGPGAMFVRRLTWNGHEFLSVLRSKTLWARVKTEAKDRGLALSFDLVRALASKFINDLI
ncbi:MAG: hypothetical protein CVV17_01115 [Gammaproteobacteria bacterium HGW-Gammaproteobacteria-7]|jgi:hypothetical protein|nr:MAG: hypothetical protein CVV17_01115 [Gammaproteobacteria bacterium HGW-Gammaproteobacteria-7]